MYLELANLHWNIKWKVAGIPKIACLGLKQVGQVVCVGIKTSEKDGLCRICSKENARAEI